MIIYFSGTGNSRFVAKKLAALTGEELVDAVKYTREGKGAAFTKPGKYVFVSPVYVSAPPRAFVDFIRKSSFPNNVLASEKGFAYLGTAQVCMPQNYIAMFKTHTAEENREVVRRALPVIEGLADFILGGVELPDPGMKAWEYISTEMIIGMYYRDLMKAKAFRVSDACIGCGRCAAACPLANISMKDRRPVWGNNCTHCMACINLCPKQAIEYGKRTEGKPRYTGPELL